MAEIAPRTGDAEIIRFANQENRLLLTEDKDFGELVFRRSERVPGLVLVRIDPSRRSIKGSRLLAAIGQFSGALFGRYTVIEEGRFRFRPLRLA
jgi:predicted nuclease of predicted toxin-antitoxin system